MRKIWVSGSLALLLIFSSMSVISAHPGRTDSKGGHTCKTNCTKWGLEYGEYHYHNGKGSSSKDSSSKSSSSSSSSTKSSTTPKSSTSKKSSTPKPSTPAYKESGLEVYVNGEKLSFSSQPVIYQNTNLVPLREIAEGLGATTTFDKESGTIEVTKGDRKVTLTIGSKKVFYNGTSETASAAPKAINGTTYVPAQVFARGLGASIEYKSSSNTLEISI
ncbi:copper amine oxidase N-terminal domain-containing protein [Paenibacillus vini]|uniref:Copper amine oxidase-like N-terminal domain-containing protein n=1 Tax=Paenibacillus vini TaxID=1476024 RepID=A0ABQ4MAI5_9BACL|nr:copper amine oxidase N-terminal domain-containing protein [Paenibacillus vini]GIP53009.1 hypothetical protein J42TS3_20440 [Paenibacillus vini]